MSSTFDQKIKAEVKIKYNNLNAQEYLTDSRFTSEEKILLFKLRCSMDDVKLNFSSMYNDTTCDLCTEGVPQDTAHLLVCRTLIDNCPALYDDIDTEYSQIFSGVDEQLTATRLFQKVFKTKKLLSEQ